MFKFLTKNRGVPDEERSYGGIFFLSVVVLTLCTGWMVVDEFFLRRPWKHYQNEANKLEYDFYEKQYLGEKKKISEIETKLNTEIGKIKGDLKKNGEYTADLTRIDALKQERDEIKLKHKFAKSKLDEAYYWYKHAQHEGEETAEIEEKKVVFNKMQKKVDGYLPDLNRLEGEISSLEDSIKKMLEPEKELKNRLRKATSDMTLYKGNMDAIRKSFLFLDFFRIPEVKQTVVKGLDTNSFKEPQLRVDRCESCHSNINKDGFEKQANPYKTHPDRKLFLIAHEKNKFGCTVCHMGQGPSISKVELGHGHFHHEKDVTPGLYEPLLGEKLITSTCRKCHEDQLDVKSAPLLSKGKRTFIKLGCHGCHMVKGYDKLRKVGPVLKRIGSKSNPDWIYRWIKKPKNYLPKTRMPFFNLSDEDATAITAYLIDSSDKTYAPDKKFTKGQGSVEDGKRFFETIGCLGCHTIDGKGGEFAPNLSRIGEKVDPDWLVSWLKNPKQYNHKTVMPSLRLSDYEADSMASYLLTKGAYTEVSGLADKIKQKDIINQGARLIRKRGCFGCHEIYGMEKENRIAPELTSFGNKRLSKLEFGDARIPHKWEAWAHAKLKNPSTFRTERVLDKMPNFELSDDEIEALLVLLKSFRGTVVPDKFRKILTDDEEAIEKGRKLVWEFNCKGCHIIENKGAFIRKFYRTINNAPPVLEGGKLHEGEKAQGLWLFGFLKKPRTIRPWLKIRMPTFYFLDEEVSILVKYFAALAKSDTIYDYIEQREVDERLIAAAKKLMSPDYLDCFYCHSFGDKKPSGPKKKWAPNLKNVKKRLRPDWIIKWLTLPSAIQPNTKMPNFFDSEDDIYEDILDGDPQEQIKALREFLIHYNSNKG